jgi:hypothetical protein
VPPAPPKTQNEKTEEHSLLLLQEEVQSPFYMSLGNGTKGGTQPASSSQYMKKKNTPTEQKSSKIFSSNQISLQV